MNRLEITEVIQSLGLETCLCHLPAVRLWETDLTFLGLGFVICSVAMIIESKSRSFVRIWKDI